MSTYREDSEVASFNASTSSTESFPVSFDTATVVTAAQAISEQSGGALDVTVHPLVGAWGFGSEPATTPPDEATVARLLRRVGFRKISHATDPPWLQKSQPDVSIDLSAIAPGFAADRLSELLTERGLLHHLVDVGGELRASGQSAPGVPWRVGIEQPDRDERSAHLSFSLCSGALATSGDYRNFHERKGVRRSHTIDPRSGHPVEHALASVSVLAPSAVLADGWATALNVLGPTEGRELATRLELPAYFIVRSAGGFETAATPAFERALRDQTCTH
jgi:thiamine biosynthesis lipoprotein